MSHAAHGRCGRLVPLAALASLLACTPAPAPQETQSAALALDLATVRAGVDAGNGAVAAGLAAKDAAAIAAAYSSTGTLFPPGAPRVAGREALQAFFQGMIDNGTAAATLETQALEIQGEVAIEQGRYTLADAQGATVDVGKYVVVWKNEEGAWRLHLDIFNSDGPISPAAPTDPAAPAPGS